MRHTLRGTVPLAFGFFLLATSASAECAWVLWLQITDVMPHQIETTSAGASFSPLRSEGSVRTCS
jgi:hypothetical protein